MQDGATQHGFTVSRSEDGLVLSGEIDIAAVGAFRSGFAGLAAEGDTVVVDLQAVSFIDSSGIEALCAARRQAGEAGGSVTLRAPSANVMRVLEVTGLDGLFRIERPPRDDRAGEGASPRP